MRFEILDEKIEDCDKLHRAIDRPLMKSAPTGATPTKTIAPQTIPQT
ncbi:hypothetical protein [Microcoleus sp.]